ncbi:hypothetical protein EVAR_13024_1 [Eumeta japonica]|uniref:Uncharacterized protein n=1 Tax=Eumeta variegata TaxID=151549 RepID=A0A4C1TWX9_EUMVA|nr:hypothetical protein EVAR_13024_1 [Eumeta japonica]
MVKHHTLAEYRCKVTTSVVAFRPRILEVDGAASEKGDNQHRIPIRRAAGRRTRHLFIPRPPRAALPQTLSRAVFIDLHTGYIGDCCLCAPI